MVGPSKAALASFLRDSRLISLTVDQVNDVTGVLATIMPSVLRMSNLQHLAVLNAGVDFATVLDYLKLGHNSALILPALRRLQISVEHAQSCIPLFPLLDRLEALEITLTPQHPLSEHLVAISACHELRSLIVSIDDHPRHQHASAPVPSTTDVTTSIVALAHACPSMQDFRLHGCNGPPNGVVPTSPTTLASLARCWPGLRRLDLHVDVSARLCASDVLHVTMACPLLRELHLAASLALATLATLPPCAIGRALERLHLHGADTEDIGPVGCVGAADWAHEVHGHLARCLPALRELRVTPYACEDVWRGEFASELRRLFAGSAVRGREVANIRAGSDILAAHGYL